MLKSSPDRLPRGPVEYHCAENMAAPNTASTDSEFAHHFPGSPTPGAVIDDDELGRLLRDTREVDDELEEWIRAACYGETPESSLDRLRRETREADERLTLMNVAYNLYVTCMTNGELAPFTLRTVIISRRELDYALRSTP